MFRYRSVMPNIEISKETIVILVHFSSFSKSTKFRKNIHVFQKINFSDLENIGNGALNLP